MRVVTVELAQVVLFLGYVLSGTNANMVMTTEDGENSPGRSWTSLTAPILVEDYPNKLETKPVIEIPEKLVESMELPTVEDYANKLESTPVVNAPEKLVESMEVTMVEDHTLESVPVVNAPDTLVERMELPMAEDVTNSLESVPVVNAPDTLVESMELPTVEDYTNTVQSVPVVDAPDKMVESIELPTVEDYAYKLESTPVVNAPDKLVESMELPMVEDYTNTLESVPVLNVPDKLVESMELPVNDAVENEPIIDTLDKLVQSIELPVNDAVEGGLIIDTPDKLIQSTEQPRFEDRSSKVPVAIPMNMLGEPVETSSTSVASTLHLITSTPIPSQAPTSISDTSIFLSLINSVSSPTPTPPRRISVPSSLPTRVSGSPSPLPNATPSSLPLPQDEIISQIPPQIPSQAYSPPAKSPTEASLNFNQTTLAPSTSFMAPPAALDDLLVHDLTPIPTSNPVESSRYPTVTPTRFSVATTNSPTSRLPVTVPNKPIESSNIAEGLTMPSATMHPMVLVTEISYFAGQVNLAWTTADGGAGSEALARCSSFDLDLYDPVGAKLAGFNVTRAVVPNVAASTDEGGKDTENVEDGHKYHFTWRVPKKIPGGILYSVIVACTSDPSALGFSKPFWLEPWPSTHPTKAPGDQADTHASPTPTPQPSMLQPDPGASTVSPISEATEGDAASLLTAHPVVIVTEVSSFAGQVDLAWTTADGGAGSEALARCSSFDLDLYDPIGAKLAGFIVTRGLVPNVAESKGDGDKGTENIEDGQQYYFPWRVPKNVPGGVLYSVIVACASDPSASGFSKPFWLEPWPSSRPSKPDTERAPPDDDDADDWNDLTDDDDDAGTNKISPIDPVEDGQVDNFDSRENNDDNDDGTDATPFEGSGGGRNHSPGSGGKRHKRGKGSKYSSDGETLKSPPDNDNGHLGSDGETLKGLPDNANRDPVSDGETLKGPPDNVNGDLVEGTANELSRPIKLDSENNESLEDTTYEDPTNSFDEETKTTEDIKEVSYQKEPAVPATTNIVPALGAAIVFVSAFAVYLFWKRCIQEPSYSGPQSSPHGGPKPGRETELARFDRMSTMSTAYGGSAEKKKATALFDSLEKKGLLAAEKLPIGDEEAGAGWDDWGDDLDGLEGLDDGPAASSSSTAAPKIAEEEPLIDLLS